MTTTLLRRIFLFSLLKITFNRTEGIMGAHDSVEIDTDSINEKEKEELYSAFETTQFLRKSSERGVGSDLFHYRISIQKVLEVDDTTKTASDLKPLIDQLMSKYYLLQNPINRIALSLPTCGPDELWKKQ